VIPAPDPNPLAVAENPYAAPRTQELGVEADPRGVAIRQKVLLWALGTQLGSLGLVLVIAILERPIRATVGAMPVRLLVGTIMIVFYAGWLVSVWSVWSLTHRLKGGWFGFLFAVMSLLPVYGVPTAWLVNLRASRFLRLKGYRAGWFGADLGQFGERSS
jgi:hypothetical protein